MMLIKLSQNDKLLLAAMKMNKQLGRSSAGRPKGAKDKQRRKNPRYYWDVADLREKFQERVTVTHDWTTPIRGDECWIWTGAASRGVGYMVIGSRQDNGGKSPRVQAHRLSYTLHLGELERRDLVAQKCGNKLCVNPRHLYTWRR